MTIFTPISSSPFKMVMGHPFVSPAYTNLITRLGSHGTFTRGSTATMWSNGKLVTAGTNIARFDTDPITRELKGLLIEEARTNVALNSEDFSTTWTDWQAVRTYNTEVAPDGTTTADTLTVNTSSSGHWVQQATTASITNDFCFSVYLKQGTATNAFIYVSDFADSDATRIGVDLSNGTIVSAGTALGVNSSYTGSGIEDAGNGWYRVWIAGIADNTTTSHKIMIKNAVGTSVNFLGNGADSVHMWGGQFEQGSFPTSYIPTAGASATRAADTNTTPMTNWYNQKASTFFFKCETFKSGQVGAIFEATGAGGNRISMYVTLDGTLTIEVETASVVQTGEYYLLLSPNGLNKIALTIEQDNLKVYVNGVEVDSDITITPPNLTDIWLSEVSWNNWYWNGWLEQARYYPVVLTAGEVGNL